MNIVELKNYKWNTMLFEYFRIEVVSPSRGVLCLPVYVVGCLYIYRSIRI